MLPHGDCFQTLAINGRLEPEGEQVPLAEVAVGGVTFTSQMVTSAIGATSSSGTASFSPEADGNFEIVFFGELGACTPVAPPFPMPDEVELILAREVLPLELDISPELRSGNGLRIVCPCEDRVLVEVNESTGDFSTANDDEFANPSRLILAAPIVVSARCDSCCSLLVLHGQIASLVEEVADMRVQRVDQMGDVQRTWVAHRQRVMEDGTFEAWFSQTTDECPPMSRFDFPDRLRLSVGRGECRRSILVELLPDGIAVSQSDDEGSFPRTTVQLQEPVVITPCEPPRTD